MLHALTQIGLSENEAKVYLALLELGSATAQQVAQKAGVNRPTTYVQLESLIKVGVVSTFERESERSGVSKTYFRAEDPDHLKKILEGSRRDLDKKEQILSETLPELGKLFLTSGERPRVRFFEGVEGLLTMQDEFLKTPDKSIESVASTDDVLGVFPTHPQAYMPRRVKKGIRAKLLYTSSQGKIFKNKDEAALREARYIPAEKFPFSFDLTLYDFHVAISVLKPKDFPYGIIIESEEVAKSFRSLFYLAWESAEKYNET